jgi:hypothetical protein
MKNLIKSAIKKHLCPLEYKKYQRYCIKNNQREFLIFNALFYSELFDLYTHF